MPVYNVFAAADRLSPAVKAQVADAIAGVHNEVTRTPRFMALVLFHDLPQENSFLGGKLLRADNVFVHGLTRLGRTPETRRELVNKLVEAVSDVTSMEKKYVWVYISELPPGQMIEFGQILPDPGKEAAWLATLPPEVRKYMDTIEH
jgi:phenylpyruvate tautomerase PptA (4-oxalocrotonate tautomerase family)